jgi:cellulose 1,4-beta-cellobiosidase
MAFSLAVYLAASALITSAAVQQPGTLAAEVHLTLTSQQCTTTGGCVAVNTSIVLDAQYRYMHNVGGYANCVVNGAFNTNFCPDAATCAKECALEGVDYSTYGIKTNGDALTLNLFTVANNVTKETSPRVYLANDSTYDILRLLNQEFTFDVDVSQVPCGINGALNLSEMSATGEASDLNVAGAKYGTGYCDAQCPVNNFVGGVVSIA